MQRQRQRGRRLSLGRKLSRICSTSSAVQVILLSLSSLLLLLLASGAFVFRAAPSAGADVEFAIVVDAGSTGTRAHLFARDADAPRLVATAKTDEAMADLGGTHHEAPESELRRLLLEALETMHRHAVERGVRWPRIRAVTILGTAGFRLLEPQQRIRAVDAATAVCESVMLSAGRDTFDGGVHVGVLSGTEEAALAWEAAASAVQTEGGEEFSRVGLVEVGGASVQVVIPTTSTAAAAGLPGAERELYVRSYLGYGAHEVEKALTQRIVNDASAGHGTIMVVESPCGFGGMKQSVTSESSISSPASIAFTGAFDACLEQVMKQLHLADIEHAGTAVADANAGNAGSDAASGGALQPIPLRLMSDTHVFGLALLHHVTHFIQVSIGGLPRFPLASAEEVAAAGRRLCSVPWHEMQSRYSGVDANTPVNRIGGRCFDAALAVALMKRLGLYGRGGSSAESEDMLIEFTHKVKDTDVDWTVGVAVNLLGSGSREPSASTLNAMFNPDARLVLGKFATVQE